MVNLNKIMQEIEELQPRLDAIVCNHTGLSIQSKGTKDFVTQIDLAVSRLLEAELPRILPGSQVLSEESENRPRESCEFVWVVDPVDGTTNFIHEIPLYAVSIGLLRNGKPVLGWVRNPAGEETFKAVQGGGAWLNGKAAKVSQAGSLSDTVVLAETNPYYPHREQTATIPMLEAFFKDCRDIRITGSAALDVCYVAAGRAGLFVTQSVNPWDFAAGVAILLEAGGVATQWDGGPLDFAASQTFVAGNEQLHGKALERLSKFSHAEVEGC